VLSGEPALPLAPELDRLQTALRLADAAIAHCDGDLVLRWVNDAYARLFGRPVGELSGMPLATLLGPRAGRAIAGVLEGATEPVDVDVEVDADQPAYGGRILHVRHAPIAARGDGMSGSIQTIRDVTAERQSEPAARLAAIVESCDDAIVGKSLTGMITSWNEGARRVFGYTADEMIGQPIQRIMPQDRVDDMHRILAKIRAGERVEHFETERVRKDGRRIQVSLTVSPIRDETGRVVGASKIARDVTDRRRAENALRETLELLATLNRTSVLLSSELELDKLVQAVTDAATEVIGARYGAFFYNVTDVRGESYMLYALSGAEIESFRSFPMPRNTAIFAPTFNGEGIVRLDDVRQDPRYGQNAPLHGMPPGHVPVTSYLAAPVMLRGEVLGGLFFGHPDPGVFSERDERFIIGIAAQAAIAMDNARLYAAERRARGDAEAASRAKDDLLSIVSHELRTPLSSILGWVAVLRKGKLDPDGVRRALDTIERSGRVQGELIDDLLDVSRVVSGSMKLELERIDLRVPCEAALDALRPDALAKGVTIEAQLDEPAIVIGDAIRLQQVVSNLVANAVKFSAEGGRVAVSLASRDDVAELVVRDDGVGIEPDFLPFAFEPFRQAEDVRKRKCGGLGLGLTIVKNLVEQQGGTVAAASPGRDRGSVFSITLPLASAARPSIAAPAVEHAPPE
jgi:PAS domain S-box-containing protein